MESETLQTSADNGAEAQGTFAEAPKEAGAQTAAEEAPAERAPAPKKDRAATKAFSEALNRLSDKKAAQAAADIRQKYDGYDDVKIGRASCRERV